jgi:hypothetical protein
MLESRRSTRKLRLVRSTKVIGLKAATSGPRSSSIAMGLHDNQPTSSMEGCFWPVTPISGAGVITGSQKNGAISNFLETAPVGPI